MDEYGHENGREPRVKFGPKGTQTIPLQYAEEILSQWAKSKPREFGNYLRAVVLADLGTPTR